jgi:hypothetical protein
VSVLCDRRVAKLMEGLQRGRVLSWPDRISIYEQSAVTFVVMHDMLSAAVIDVA